MSLETQPAVQPPNALSSQALLTAQRENDDLHLRLSQAAAKLAEADEELEGARRDVHFLRMRVGVLQAFIDDLQIEIAERSGDVALLAKRYDAVLSDRDRIVRELIAARDTLVAAQITARGKIETLTAFGIAQRAHLIRARDAEHSERAAIVGSASWKVTKPLRLVAASVRRFGALRSKLRAR